MSTIDPICMNCYVQPGKKWCRRCRRRYCSSECQTEDWRKKGHDKWCGKAGELGKDFVIKDSPQKLGVGIFALRDFNYGDLVLVEYPIFTANIYRKVTFPKDVAEAMKPIMPAEGTLAEKFLLNRLSSQHELLPSLYITASRINHDCIGNVIVTEDKDTNCLLFKCFKHVSSGDEITFCYFGGFPTEEARREELVIYKFSCHCDVCVNEDKARKVATAFDLFESSRVLAADCDENQRTRAMYDGYSALQNMLDLQLQPGIVLDLYLHLFLVSMIIGRPLEESKDLAKKVIPFAAMFAEENADQLSKCRALAENPLLFFDESYKKFFMDREEQRENEVIPTTSSRFAKAKVCSTCYKPAASFRCKRCLRRYCDQECQKLDWTKNLHKKWCGKSGQLDKDFGMKETLRNGIGIFALRDFKRGELVIVEKPVFTFELGKNYDTGMLPENVVIISKALDPATGSTGVRLSRNSIVNPTTGIGGLYPITARMNNHCIGNTFLYHTSSQVFIKCSRDINAGDELTRAYAPIFDYDLRSKVLLESLGFTCNCTACTDPLVSTKLSKIMSLRSDLSGQLPFPLAEEKMKCLAALCDELSLSPFNNVYNYYRLFMAEALRSGRNGEAKEYAEKLRYSVELWQDGITDATGIIEDLTQNPSRIGDVEVFKELEDIVAEAELYSYD